MKNPRFAVLIIALCVAAACAQGHTPAGQPLATGADLQTPLHIQATAEAWTAFRAGRNETAIAKANECIARFGETANRIEALLESNKVTLPNGVLSADDKKKIARYQILHDVATCYLIKCC